MIDLIDAHAELHRAHHAPMSELTAPGGQPTKALYLFLRLVYKHALDEGAAVVVCWDTPKEKLKRRQWYPDYKADRKTRTPDNDGGLSSQMALAKRILTDAGIRQVRSLGWEADDAIATLARRERKRANLVRIVGRDKDLHQCVRSNVVMLNSSTGEITDAKAVCARWEVDSPQQVIEVQTLLGDSTDNVAGVKGVGIKTAVKLIKRYKTAFNAFGHAGSEGPALAKAFEAADYDLLRKLVKLKTNCKLQIKQQHETIDFTRASSLLKRLNIRHLDA